MKKSSKKKQKDPRGGPGRGQGRKPKFNEPTDTIAFRFPISLIEQIRQSDNANERAYNALKKEFDGIQDEQGTDAKNG